MNKFKLSFAAAICITFLTACSSSSKGGTDNSDQIRQTEAALTQQIVALNQQVATSQQQAQRNQANQESVKAEADKAQAEVTKLNAEVANLTQELAALKVQTLEQNQANIEKTSEELEKAKQALAKAQEDAQAANKAVEELKANEEKALAEKQATEARLKELENLQADEKARVPLSEKAFGGVSGVMSDPVNGATMKVNSDSTTVDRTLSNDIQYITVVDDYGVADRRITLADSEYNDYIGQAEYSSNIANTDQFKSTGFGVYSADPYNPTEKIFYSQGNPTAIAQIPTAGTIKYNGGVAYLKDGVSFARTGKMNATANFDTKVIDIHIDKRENTYYNTVQIPEMHFGGKITGNSFAGEVDGIKTQGGFFGENAKELSGIFTNEADKSRGVFGAIKQE